jgi:hypothetical protein
VVTAVVGVQERSRLPASQQTAGIPAGALYACADHTASLQTAQ